MSRILAWAKAVPKTATGSLRIWHANRFEADKGKAFEDCTFGGLLREFYLSVVIELEGLKAAGKKKDHSLEELDRIADLEDLLRPEHRASLRNLSEKDSLDEWFRPRFTGDPLTDYWEYRISKALPVDLEVNKAPPREEWDHA